MIKVLPTTATFFGGSAAVPTSAISGAFAVSDVTPDDAGIKTLAAAGRWMAVAALAERLEGESLEARTMYPTEASLRYTLIRVQAYTKLQMFDRLKQLFDTIGNFNDSRFSVPAVSSSSAVHSMFFGHKDGERRSIVPFSLWFLHAQLPMLCGNLQDSQVRLYDLLARCEQQITNAAAPQTSSTAASHVTALVLSPQSLSLWKQRVRRVRRALVGNHFELEQFSAALSIQRELADTETNELQHLVAVQMLGCMCLRSGNSTLATEVFRAIERMQVDDDAYDKDTNDSLALTKEVMVVLNHGLLLSFHGYFGEACATLRNIMSGLPVEVAVTITEDGDAAGAGGVPQRGGGGGPKADAVAVRQQLRRYAATSLSACLPFLHRNDAPDAPPAPPLNSSVSVPVLSSAAQQPPPSATSASSAPLSGAGAGTAQLPTSTLPRTSVHSLLAFMEEQIRSDPRGMLHVDAFIQNYYRAVDLENATIAASAAMASTGPDGAVVAPQPTSPSRSEVVEVLLEQFRGWRDARRGRVVNPQ